MDMPKIDRHEAPKRRSEPEVETPPRPVHKNRELYWLVGGIAIIGLIFIAYKFGKQPVVPTPTQPSPIFVNGPASSAAVGPTANWNTYRNEKYGFETEYILSRPPVEAIGTDVDGQFGYFLKVSFGTDPLTSSGYEVRVTTQQSLENFQSELIGHQTDYIDSEEQTILNGTTWTKINYKLFLAIDNVPFTTAITNHAGYSYAIISPELDIDQILSTFKFVE